MRFLLDTHVLLWWLGDVEMAGQASAAIADPKNEIFVSAASVWEIAIKRSLGKLDAPDDLVEEIELNGFSALPITATHADLAGSLPRHHDDLFDRMLIAQASQEQLLLMTRDEAFGAYEVQRFLA